MTGQILTAYIKSLPAQNTWGNFSFPETGIVCIMSQVAKYLYSGNIIYSSKESLCISNSIQPAHFNFLNKKKEILINI